MSEGTRAACKSETWVRTTEIVLYTTKVGNSSYVEPRVVSRCLETGTERYEKLRVVSAKITPMRQRTWGSRLKEWLAGDEQ